MTPRDYLSIFNIQDEEGNPSDVITTNDGRQFDLAVMLFDYAQHLKPVDDGKIHTLNQFIDAHFKLKLEFDDEYSTCGIDTNHKGVVVYKVWASKAVKSFEAPTPEGVLDKYKEEMFGIVRDLELHVSTKEKYDVVVPVVVDDSDKIGDSLAMLLVLFWIVLS